MNSLNDVWELIKEHMSQELNPITIKTWFDEVSVVTMEDSAIVLHCPNKFKKDTIEARFVPTLKKAAKEIFSADLEVKLLDDDLLAAYHGIRPDRADTIEGSEGFTFETFVVGPQNKLAYAAARATAEKTVDAYNPLFIYGDSGLGKTHLLYAIAHLTRKVRPEVKITYIKGEDFINEFIELIRAGRGGEFRAKYRESDMLLVDDIQFVAGKQQVQDEFFHTFNCLYEAGHQIVLTSDRPPREMTLLDDRLRTRFEWGLMVDVAAPDYETRLAIIRNKAALLGLKLTDRIMDFIAENVTANVRQIEGTLNRILAIRDLTGQGITQEELEKIIMDMLRQKDFLPAPADIIAYICRYYEIDESILRGQERRRDVTLARQIAMYLMRRINPNMSLNDIGKEFDGRDHSTVLHSLEKVEKQMRSDPAFAETVKEITTNINSKK